MEIDAKRQLIQAKISREVELTAAEEAIVTAVHGVFDKYDLNKDGVLSEDEVRPFFINFNQLVIGMSAEIAHDDQTILDSTEGVVYGAPGGKQYYSTITKVEIFCLLLNYQSKQAAEKATQDAKPLVEEKKEASVGGKHSVGDVNWNPKSDIQFSHALTDGSEEALKALVEKIFQKYDTDSDNKLFLDDAKPFIKQFCKDEMEMNAGKDMIEDTWMEMDEEQKGFVEREDIMKYLQAQWDLKN